MKKSMKFLALALAVMLFAGLMACGTQTPATSTDPSSAVTESADPSTEPSATSAKFRIMEGSLAEEEYGIGFRKGDELRDIVNAAMKVLAADGTLAKISDTWFGEDITTVEADATALDGIEVEAREFVLGLDDSFPPMGYRDSNNEVVGFDIDVAKAVCEKLGWTLKIQPIDWDTNEMELNAGNVDCLWNGMTLTDARKESMSCSDAYMKNKQVVVVMADSTYQTKEDLAGKSLALQTGSSAEEALASAAEFKASLGTVNTFKDNMTCFMDLEQGSSEAVLVDSIVADWYIKTGNVA